MNVIESGTQKGNDYSGFNILRKAQKIHHSQYLKQREAIYPGAVSTSANGIQQVKVSDFSTLGFGRG